MVVASLIRIWKVNSDWPRRQLRCHIGNLEVAWVSSILVSVKKVSPQNVGFLIRAIELAPRLFVAKAKPVFMEIHKNLSSLQMDKLTGYIFVTG